MPTKEGAVKTARDGFIIITPDRQTLLIVFRMHEEKT